MQKLIASIAIAIVTLVGMRVFGVTFGDIFKAISKDANNAATDIKALANGDYSKAKLPDQPRATVSANEGDYDDDMKKDLSEARQKLMDDRKKALEKFTPGSSDRKALENMTPDEMRKHIERNLKEAKD